MPTDEAETATNVPDAAAAPSNADTDAPPTLSKEDLDDDDDEDEEEMEEDDEDKEEGEATEDARAALSPSVSDRMCCASFRKRRRLTRRLCQCAGSESCSGVHTAPART